MIVSCLIVIISLATLSTAEAEEDFIEKQKWALNYLKQIYFVGKYDDEVTSKKFPITDTDNFMRADVLEKWLEANERGTVDKDNILSFQSETVLSDSVKLFDVLLYAKDWDAFVKIAEWGKQNLNAMLMAFAFYAAVYNRKDCDGIILPPVFEAFPNFFIPTQIIKQAHSAHGQGITKWNFPMNNTGYQWNGNSDYNKNENLDNKISYFREDVLLGNWFIHRKFYISSFMSKRKYNHIKYTRRGEALQALASFLLSRYNMERYTNWLAPESPLEFNKPLNGYKSHLNDVYGKGFLERVDGLVPLEHNYEEATQVEKIISKFKDNLLFKAVPEPGRNLSAALEGMNTLGSALYGSVDSSDPYLPRNLFHRSVLMLDGMTRVTNGRDFTSTAGVGELSSYRDPAHYKMLASLREIEEAYLNKLPPYSKQELELPGVEINEVKFNHLETFFERYNFSIGNIFPSRPEANKVDYTVSSVRLNHKPFTYDIKITSDRRIEAYIKIFIGPLNDNDYRPLTINQARGAYYTLDSFIAELNIGVNNIQRSSLENKRFQDYELWSELEDRMRSAEVTATPLIPGERLCAFPRNLMLPRGWPTGAMFSVITTVNEFNDTLVGQYPCNYQYLFDQHSYMFPLDRKIIDNNFQVKNIKISEIEVYHTLEQDEVS